MKSLKLKTLLVKESSTRTPLTLTSLVENNMINEGLGDFFSGLRGVFGGNRARRNAVMAFKARRLQRAKTGSDTPLLRGSDDVVRAPKPEGGGLLSRLRMRQGARSRFGESPRVSDKELRTVGTDAAAGRARRRQDIKNRLQAMSKKATPQRETPKVPSRTGLLNPSRPRTDAEKSSDDFGRGVPRMGSRGPIVRANSFGSKPQRETPKVPSRTGLLNPSRPRTDAEKSDDDFGRGVPRVGSRGPIVRRSSLRPVS